MLTHAVSEGAFYHIEWAILMQNSQTELPKKFIPEEVPVAPEPESI